MIRASARAAVVAALAGSPLVLALVPEPSLPAGLAYLVHDGWPVVAFVMALALVACAAASLRSPMPAKLFDRVSARTTTLLMAGLGLLAVLALIPGARWNGAGFGGDEPKYLRLAESLLRDLDVDVASQSEASWTLVRFAGNARRLLRDVGDAIAELGAAGPAEGHRWSLGNWTVQGAHGGQYYVQSPGLPIALLPSLVVRELVALDKPPAFLPLVTLAAFWTIALLQTVKLASEVSGSRSAGLAAGTLTALSAPLLVGGIHFYPETAAVALVPWLLRHARRDAALPRTPTAMLVGLGCGFLPWLHPKFLLTALVLVILFVWKARSRRVDVALAAGSFAVVIGGLLLYDHHVTGLLRPDALYARFGSSIYRGPTAVFSPMLVNGLVNSLFGARDGLFVTAPVLLCGALAIGIAWRHDRHTTLELLAVFTSLWIAAAIHEGGAPGPPGRLLAPVACMLAAFLAIGFVRLRQRLAFLLTALVLGPLALAITIAMFDDWRRTNNPYREMFGAPARDFAKDLPDGPGRGEAPYELHKSRDRLRGAALFALVGFWSLWFARHPADAAFHRAGVVARWACAFWVTLGAATFALSALGP